MRTKSEMVGDLAPDSNPRVVAGNTVEYTRADGARVIRHFDTDILVFRTDGAIEFYNGGHFSPTTKERLNTFQDKVAIYQERKTWWARERIDGEPVEWHEGLTWTPAGNGPGRLS